MQRTGEAGSAHDLGLPRATASRRVFVVAAAAALTGCAAAEVRTFPTIASARAAIEGLASGWKATGAWTLAQFLEHAAQSIEYSIAGFPQPNSALFQATAGAAAWAFFDARGSMRHALDEPIPGAPAIARDAPLPQAIVRVLAALAAFESHTGPPKPHFAYGTLDKPQYTRAHLMHLADHWQQLQRA